TRGEGYGTAAETRGCGGEGVVVRSRRVAKGPGNHLGDPAAVRRDGRRRVDGPATRRDRERHPDPEDRVVAAVPNEHGRSDRYSGPGGRGLAITCIERDLSRVAVSGGLREA